MLSKGRTWKNKDKHVIFDLLYSPSLSCHMQIRLPLLSHSLSHKVREDQIIFRPWIPSWPQAFPPLFFLQTDLSRRT